MDQLFVYHTTIRRLRWSYSAPDVRRLFRASWPMMLVVLVFFVPLNAGVLIVRTLRGDAEAAIYTIAYQVANAYYGFASLAVQIVQPHITGTYGLEASFIRKLALFAVVFFGGLALLAGVGGFVMIRGLLLPLYYPATTPLAFLLAGAMLMLVGNIAHVYLLRFHEQRFLLAVHAIQAVLYVVGSTCLVIPLGLVPVAAWTVFTVLLGTGVCLGRVRAKLRTDATE